MTLTVAIRHQLGTFTLDAAFTSQGGVTALFGRSGSGKTSVVRIVAGLMKPDHGKISLDGQALVDTDKRLFVPRHRRRFGYVFQEARLFPHLTVRQNLNYGRWFAPKSEQSSNFDQIVDMLGIGALLSRRPGKLSGGEKQRVAIGRALLSSPRLLLMDEPLAALDEARKAEILPYLERLRDETKTPIVYVSHSMVEVVRLANHVIVMHEGRVEVTGSPVDVFSSALSSPAVERREAGTLLEGRVGEIMDGHGLTVVLLKAGRLYVPGRSRQVGANVRVNIPARDVLLATMPPDGLSALNILQGKVDRIGTAEDGMVEVRVDCGGDLVRARLTSFSLERMKLAIGTPVYTIIKTAALET